MIKTVGGWVLVVALCGMASAALAQKRVPVESGPLRFHHDPTVTTISGAGSSLTTRLSSQDETSYGLYGLRMSERSDEPCHVVALFEHLRNEEDDRVAVWSDCGSNGPTSKSNAAAGFGDLDGQDQRAFVTGLEACVNNDKVKGVRVSGQKITPRGRMRAVRPPPPPVIRVAGPLPRAHTPNETEPTYDVFWRPNCDQGDWRPAANCPDGKAATALILHRESAAPRGQVSGLQLECRTVLAPPLLAIPSQPE